MTIGLLLQTILVGLAVIGLGFLCFGIMFEKNWLLYTFGSIFIILFLYVIVLSFIYQNFPHVWKALL